MLEPFMSTGNLCVWSHNLLHVATATALAKADLHPVQSLSAQNSSGHTDKRC